MTLDRKLVETACLELWREYHTQIEELVFEGTIKNCHFENCTFKGVKFQNATIINTFFRYNRKLSRVQFIDCKVDKLTYAFLRNGKADLTGITLITQ